MDKNQTVFVVDDDVSIRNSVKWLLDSVRIPALTFDSAAAFLTAYSLKMDGCVILDVRMPGMSGTELMKRFHQLGGRIPIIFLSAHGDIPMAVQALKDGAFDFIEKPYKNQQLLDCVQRALELNAQNKKRRSADETLQHHLDGLTQRERQILDLVVAGKTNKEIGQHLCISYKTVESHRSRLMMKMSASNLAELIRTVTAYRAGQL